MQDACKHMCCMLYSPHVQQYRAKKICHDQKWQGQQADEEAEAPLGLLFRLLVWVGEYYPPERRKEAIRWKTHFLAVANVGKVIWFRFRISVAKELPSSTRPGFVLTPPACTT